MLLRSQARPAYRPNTTVANVSSMPTETGIVGIIGRMSHPQPGGKPSIHQPMPATGTISNHGFAMRSASRVYRTAVAVSSNLSTSARVGNAGIAP